VSGAARLGALGLLLLATMLVAAMVGPYALTPADIAGALLGRLAGNDGGTAATVLFGLRLPRVAAAALIGAGLGSAGAAYQCVFRNPLVSPDILGVSSGAGLGAAVGILLGLPVIGIQLLGFGGGLVTVALVLAVGRALASDDVLVLVLAGIVVGAIAGAAIALAKVLADPYEQLPAITFWLLGSLAGFKASDLPALAVAVVVGVTPLVLLRWRIGVLMLGDAEAASLGVAVPIIRLSVIAGATLATAAAVAAAGIIGWIGLMVPHVARLVVGARFDRLLPASALTGAALLVAIDTLARTIARIEVPLGVLTAVIGGGLFLALMLRARPGLKR
jgi:iron complex transport system permease protein